jgi:hypothetical protein
VLERWSFGGSQLVLVLVLEWFLTRSFTVVDSVIEALTWLRLGGIQYQLVMPVPFTSTALARIVVKSGQIANSILFRLICNSGWFLGSRVAFDIPTPNLT